MGVRVVNAYGDHKFENLRKRIFLVAKQNPTQASAWVGIKVDLFELFCFFYTTRFDIEPLNFGEYFVWNCFFFVIKNAPPKVCLTFGVHIRNAESLYYYTFHCLVNGVSIFNIINKRRGYFFTGAVESRKMGSV